MVHAIAIRCYHQYCLLFLFPSSCILYYNLDNVSKLTTKAFLAFLFSGRDSKEEQQWSSSEVTLLWTLLPTNLSKDFLYISY